MTRLEIEREMNRIAATPAHALSDADCRRYEHLEDQLATLTPQDLSQLNLLELTRPVTESPPTPGWVIPAGTPRSYATLFGAPEPSPWKAGEFLRCALHGLHDPRLQFMGAQCDRILRPPGAAPWA